MPPLHRRNFLPTVIVTLFFWVVCGTIVFFLDPEKNLNVVLFFITIALTLTLTFALLLGNTKKGFLLSLLISLFLLSRLI